MRQCKLIIDGVDIEAVHKIYLIESPHDLSAPIRPYETETYPEEDGVTIYPFTSDEAFEYKVSLCYFGDESTANTVLNDLYESFFIKTEHLRKAKEVTIDNLYKGVVIVGYPRAMNGTGMEVTAGKETWFFDLTFYVAEPHKCSFK